MKRPFVALSATAISFTQKSTTQPRTWEKSDKSCPSSLHVWTGYCVSSGPALGMFELFGRTGPPISGVRRFGEQK